MATEASLALRRIPAWYTYFSFCHVALFRWQPQHERGKRPDLTLELTSFLNLLENIVHALLKFEQLQYVCRKRNFMAIFTSLAQLTSPAMYSYFSFCRSLPIFVSVLLATETKS